MTALENGVALDHPAGSILVAYGLGQLPDAELASIDIHLADCPECRQVVEGVVPDTLLTLLRSAATEPDSLRAHTLNHVPSEKPLAPPAELLAHPRYRVGDLLGIGGMGAVYKAEHLLMERPVALKVLNRKLIDNPATTDRFRREVRAAARLTHPNIVAAFDAEQAGDVHFLVMEFVDGISLARLAVEKGPLPVAEACDYIRQAALGLQHAHDRGMVHRDIKPQNLMLTPAGQIKILDFGLARFVMESAPADTSLSLEAEPAAGSEAAIRLTHTGLVMGTPDYIAPEQARDSHLADIRADIYSLGCTLYDLLAGQAPFPDGNAVHKVRGHLSRTPQPLDSLRRDVPPELVRILDRMMAKDPAHRFQTPADVAAALTPLVAAPPPPRRKRWPALAACFGFLALVLAGAIIYVQTDNGRIVIETNDDKIAVMIQKAGGVKIIDQATGREYRLQPGEHTKPSGDYLIDVTEPLAGLEFQTKKFELKRGKEVRLTAKFVADHEKDRNFGAPPANAALDEGSYQGKPTRHWIQQFDGAALESRLEAIKALGSIARKNPNVIPILASALDENDDQILEATSASLSALGPAGVPALQNALKKKASTASIFAALSALRQIGPGAKAAVPTLLEALNSGNFDIRRMAIEALGQIGPDSAPALPKIVQILAEELNTPGFFDRGYSFGFCDTVRDALQEIDPNAKKLLADVAPELLRKKDNKFISASWQKTYEQLNSRYASQRARLGNGDGSTKAIEADFRRHDINDDGQLSINEMPEQLRREIDRWDRNRDGQISQEEFQAFYANRAAAIDREPASQTPSPFDEGTFQGKPTRYWLQQLEDGDPQFRLDAVKAIAGIAQRNKALLPILVGALGDEVQYVGVEARDAIPVIVSPDATIIPMLLDALRKKPSAHGFRNSCEIAGRLGHEGKSAIPILIESLRKDDDKIVDSFTISALSSIGSEAKTEAMPAMPLIVELLGKRVELSESAAKKWDDRRSLPEQFLAPRAFLYTIRDIDEKAGKAFTEKLLSDDVKSKKDAEELVVLWRRAYETLKKQYPYTPAQATPIQPQTGNVQNPAGNPPAAGEDFFQGKHASFWINQIRDGDAKFRVEAVKSIGGIARSNQKYMPILIRAMEDPDEIVAFMAARELGASREKAWPALAAVFHGSESHVAIRYAILAVGQMGAAAKDAAPVIIHAMKSKDDRVCGAAFFALGKIGAEPNVAIPAMVEALRRRLNSPTFLFEQVTTVGSLKSKDGETIWRTGRGSVSGGHENSRIGMNFIATVVKLDPELRPVFEVVLNDLQASPAGGKKTVPDSKDQLGPSERQKEWSIICDTITKNYPPLPSASPLGGSTKDDAPLYLGKPAAFWINQYQDAAPKLRIEAIEALGNLAAKDKKLVPLVVAGLNDRGPLVGVKASEILGGLGPDVLPEILAGVDRTSPRSLSLAATAIGGYFAKGKAAVPMLGDALKLDDWTMRRSATAALLRIGPDALPAAPALVELLGVALDTPEVVAGMENVKNRMPGQMNAGLYHMPVEITEALLRIDPGIKAILPEGILDSGKARTASGINLSAPVALWKQTYDVLKKRYPPPANIPMPVAPPPVITQPPQVGNVALDIAALQDGPLYQNKPAKFWLEQMKDASPKFRLEAVEAIGALAAKKTSLIPDLAAMLKDRESTVAAKASEQLLKLGPDAIPVILKTMDETSPTALRYAADAIGSGPKGKAAVPMFMRALKVDAWQTRSAAVEALGRIGPDAKPALPEIVDFLGGLLERPEIVRQINAAAAPKTAKEKQFPKNAFADNTLAAETLEILLMIHPILRHDLPEGIFDAEGTRTRSGISLTAPLATWKQAHEALRKAYPQPANEAPAAPPNLEPNGKVVPKQSANIEKRLYKGEPVSFWLEQLKAPNWIHRAEAVDVLGEIIQTRKDLIPTLAEALRDEKGDVQFKAIHQLAALGREAIPSIEAILKDPDNSTEKHYAKSQAIIALRQMGPRAKPALPVLIEMLRKESHLRQNVVEALDQLGPDAKAAMPALVGLLGRLSIAETVLGSPMNPIVDLGDRRLFERILGAAARIDPETQPILKEFESNAGKEATAQGRELRYRRALDALRLHLLNSAPAIPPDAAPKNGTKHAAFTAIVDPETIAAAVDGSLVRTASESLVRSCGRET